MSEEVFGSLCQVLEAGFGQGYQFTILETLQEDLSWE